LSAGTTYEINPMEINDYEGYLYVENLTPQTIMYGGPESLTLGPKGSRDGVVFLPPQVASSPAFHRTLRRGRVRVITQEGYNQLVSGIDERDREIQAARNAEIRSLMEEPPSSKDMYPVRNTHGEIEFESLREKEASGRAGVANDETLVSIGQVPISTGVDESTGTDSVQNVQVILTDTMKEGK